MTSKTSITVSIDLDDEHEKKLFDYVMSKGPRKKSGYIKRLIHADMIGISEVSPVVYVEDDESEDEEDDLKAMLDFT